MNKYAVFGYPYMFSVPVTGDIGNFNGLANIEIPGLQSNEFPGNMTVMYWTKIDCNLTHGTILSNRGKLPTLDEYWIEIIVDANECMCNGSMCQCPVNTFAVNGTLVTHDGTFSVTVQVIC